MCNCSVVCGLAFGARICIADCVIGAIFPATGHEISNCDYDDLYFFAIRPVHLTFCSRSGFFWVLFGIQLYKRQDNLASSQQNCGVRPGCCCDLFKSQVTYFLRMSFRPYARQGRCHGKLCLGQCMQSSSSVGHYAPRSCRRVALTTAARLALTALAAVISRACALLNSAHVVATSVQRCRSIFYNSFLHQLSISTAISCTVIITIKGD